MTTSKHNTIAQLGTKMHIDFATSHFMSCVEFLKLIENATLVDLVESVIDAYQRHNDTSCVFQIKEFSDDAHTHHELNAVAITAAHEHSASTFKSCETIYIREFNGTVEPWMIECVRVTLDRLVKHEMEESNVTACKTLFEKYGFTQGFTDVPDDPFIWTDYVIYKDSPVETVLRNADGEPYAEMSLRLIVTEWGEDSIKIDMMSCVNHINDDENITTAPIELSASVTHLDFDSIAEFEEFLIGFDETSSE